MSYIDKYIKNIKPSDLKVSFWGGDAVLQNLELRLDVLERELHVPLKFKSGCIRRLTLHLPWNAIASTSVEVIIQDLELVIELKSLLDTSSDVQVTEENVPDSGTSETGSPPTVSAVVEQASSADGTKEPAPGYLHGYLNRIINNVSVQVQNMVVKVIEEKSNLMLTLNVGSIHFHTANDRWEKEFVYTDYFQDDYALHKVCRVDDVAVNLHPIEMKEKAQGSLLHEPFINRCSFACRLKYEYKEDSLAKKIFEVLLDTLELSVDEKQFCLFVHLLDWLVAMYYSTKKLKGRDDELSPESKETHGGGREMEHGGAPDASRNTDINQRDQIVVSDSETPAVLRKDADASSKVTNELPSSTTPPDQNTTGWGSWAWSFVASSDTDTLNLLPDSDKTVLMSNKKPEQSEMHFIITAKSVVLNLKMIQEVQVPVFFSVRSFTSPVLRISFEGCMMSLNKSPLTQQFLVSVGIVGVKGEAIGLCPCVKKFPSSWRRASVASTSDASEPVRRERV